MHCINCGAVARYYRSESYSSTTCKACGFHIEVDLDRLEEDKYWRRGRSMGYVIPRGCLLVIKWVA